MAPEGRSVGNSSSSKEYTQNSSVLGRFLKLGKSKSDAKGSIVSYRSQRPSPSQELEDDDFRLSPLTVRDPVEKMVQNRRDVSRSHSWIYGSVKLPSDLPFGYPSHGNGPFFNSNGSPYHHHPVNSCHENQYGSSYNFHGNHNESSPCDACSNKKESPSAAKALVSSVRNKLTWKSLKQAVVKKRPSLDSLRISDMVYSNPNGHGVSSGYSVIEKSSSFQDMPLVVSDHHATIRGHHRSSPPLSSNGVNYFFPEKKTFFPSGSCGDLCYGENGPRTSPQITASVRLRPKKHRESWHFPAEFGPTRNENFEPVERISSQEPDLYHSEWDLRECMPYDVWVNTTTNVKSRNTSVKSGAKEDCKEFEPSPEIQSRRKNSVTTFNTTNNNSGVSISKTCGTQTPDKELSDSGSNSSASTIMNAQISDSGEKKKNEIVRRSSILANELTAYQLLRTQLKREFSEEKHSSEGGSHMDDNSGDDLSENVLLLPMGTQNEASLRIAGQGISMAKRTAPTSWKNSNPVRTHNSHTGNSNNNRGADDGWDDDHLTVAVTNSRLVDPMVNDDKEEDDFSSCVTRRTIVNQTDNDGKRESERMEECVQADNAIDAGVNRYGALRRVKNRRNPAMLVANKSCGGGNRLRTLAILEEEQHVVGFSNARSRANTSSGSSASSVDVNGEERSYSVKIVVSQQVPVENVKSILKRQDNGPSSIVSVGLSDPVDSRGIVLNGEHESSLWTVKKKVQFHSDAPTVCVVSTDEEEEIPEKPIVRQTRRSSFEEQVAEKAAAISAKWQAREELENSVTKENLEEQQNQDIYDDVNNLKNGGQKDGNVEGTQDMVQVDNSCATNNNEVVDDKQAELIDNNKNSNQAKGDFMLSAAKGKNILIYLGMNRIYRKDGICFGKLAF